MDDAPKYIYLVCPRCLNILPQLESLSTNIPCPKCHKEVMEQEHLEGWRYLLFIESIILEQVKPHECRISIDDKICGGERIRYKGLSVCAKCETMFFLPYLSVKEKGREGKIGKVIKHYRNLKSIPKIMFTFQEWGWVMIFEEQIPMTKNKYIYSVWLIQT